VTTLPEDREFDIVVWGATGFTGALVVEYLLKQYGLNGQIRWAIAGRDPSKLQQLKDKLGESAIDLKTVVADSFDDDSLGNITRNTRVVLTTVGPYAKYGSPLVAACVRDGTHYCDLAGEVQWIRKMVDEHHEQATITGAKIVNCCGFDSVPMDIGVWFLQDAVYSKYGKYCASVTTLVRAMKGTASGGTIASMLNLIEESQTDREIARTVTHPYCLNPVDERSGPDHRDQRNARLDDSTGYWTAPFVMAGVNTRVVRRSHALQGFPFGRDFRYHEAVITGKGTRGRIKAASITFGLGMFMLAASIKFTRKLMQRFILPAPGEGPDRAAREAGYFNLIQIGRMPDGTIARSVVKGDRDPGYGSTCKMIAECAVCLAKDDLSSTGGVLTPATAMGRQLHQRLQENAGVTFALDD
jgi:short subunit dehydrogenase-like uncharacterized protein